MTDKCPDCGVPLDEIPYLPCRYNRDHLVNAGNAARLRHSARPWSQKIEESADFAEMQEHLVDYFRSIDQ